MLDVGWNVSTYNRIGRLLLSVDDSRCEDCAGGEGRSHSRDGALDVSIDVFMSTSYDW